MSGWVIAALVLSWVTSGVLLYMFVGAMSLLGRVEVERDELWDDVFDAPTGAGGETP